MSHFLCIKRESQESDSVNTHVIGSISRLIQPEASLQFGDERLVKLGAAVRVPSQAEDLPEDDSEGPDIALRGEDAFLQAFYSEPLHWHWAL